MNATDRVDNLIKALEAGSYDAAPSTLTQGAARSMEDLSSTYYTTTFEQKHVKLQKELKVSSCKALDAQFVRQLSYGRFGGSVAREGQIGREQTNDWVRLLYPMAFYSEIRQVSIQSTLVATFDGTSNEESEAKAASLRLSADIERHLWTGLSHYSNAGVFDGNPLVVPNDIPMIHGIDIQVRQSDGDRRTQDLMFAAYGSDESVVLAVGGPLTQDRVEDASLRSNLGFGDAKKLFVDPVTMSNYNKITLGKERYLVGNSAADVTGATLRRQFVSSGTVELDDTNFLRGQQKPEAPSRDSTAAPTHSTAVAAAGANVPAGTHYYQVTAVNELESESPPSAAASQLVAAGEKVTVTITPPGSGTVRAFKVYRGATAASCKFIGMVANSGAATTDFVDLGNRLPGFVNAYLLDISGFECKELAPFTKMELPAVQLHKPSAFYRFLTLGCLVPRQQVILENMPGAN